MKRFVLAGLLVVVPSIAHADEIQQDNQLVFGVVGTYMPAQNNLVGTDIFAVGHYVAYSRSIDAFHVGFRLAFAAATGPQYTIDPDAFIGFHLHAGRFAFRFEAGTGPLVNGGDGFATAVIDHTYVRASAQLRIVKSVIVEAFGGPSFVIGPNLAGVMAEWGLGAGWNF